MSGPLPLTALVLAGTRPGGDPLAQAAGVSHKALIPVGGVPMLSRVLAALAVAPGVARIVVAIDSAQVVQSLVPCGKPVEVMGTGSGPSATVAMALAQLGTPLLVTTADHALLRAEWIGEFLDAACTFDADAVVGLARREAVLAAVPDTQRTWLNLADGAFSGCNLFLLRTPAAGGIVQLWQQLEAERKRPLALLWRLGLLHVLRFRFGRLTLQRALDRLGVLSGSRLARVLLSDGRAAIDVDKPADLELVRRLLSGDASTIHP